MSTRAGPAHNKLTHANHANPHGVRRGLAAPHPPSSATRQLRPTASARTLAEGRWPGRVASCLDG
eukprot:2807205-Prymnesium_polylepis.1